MNEYLLDTDMFSLFLQSDANVVRAVIAHMFDPLSVSVITVQEVTGGPPPSHESKHRISSRWAILAWLER